MEAGNLFSVTTEGDTAEESSEFPLYRRAYGNGLCSPAP